MASEQTLQRVRDALLHAQNCTSQDTNDETRAYTQQLVEKVKQLKDPSTVSLENQDVKELVKRFEGRLQFGTAGLRGPMGAGSMCMNDLTIIQATQVSETSNVSFWFGNGRFRFGYGYRA